MSESQEEAQPALSRWLYWGAWFIAIALVVFAGYLGWRVTSAQAVVPDQFAIVPTQRPQQTNSGDLSLPELSEPDKPVSIFREINLHTIIPSRPRQDPQDYTVDTGDSVFAIAKSFGLEPESTTITPFRVTRKAILPPLGFSIAYKLSLTSIKSYISLDIDFNPINNRIINNGTIESFFFMINF